ncbi:MAG: DinB family protein [Sphingobacteriaceae bacterium]|nr:DinB family protein [Sphingobacteriaceae bacterium]
MRPQQGTYPAFLETYISKVKEDHILDALKANTQLLESFLKSIPQDKGDYAYAPGKWTIKQLIIHISDAERIFLTELYGLEEAMRNNPYLLKKMITQRIQMPINAL